MTYHGYIKNGAVIIEEPMAFPEGTPVEISVVALAEPVSPPSGAYGKCAGLGLEEPDDLPLQPLG